MNEKELLEMKKRLNMNEGYELSYYAKQCFKAINECLKMVNKK